MGFRFAELRPKHKKTPAARRDRSFCLESNPTEEAGFFRVALIGWSLEE